MEGLRVIDRCAIGDVDGVVADAHIFELAIE